jgi:hypothetical protein
MTVLMLLTEIRNQLSHNIQQIVLQELQIEGVDIVGALLNHYGAGGMVGSHTYGTVLYAGSGNDLTNLLGNVVEGGDPASGLKLDFFLVNLEFHDVVLLVYVFVSQ